MTNYPPHVRQEWQYLTTFLRADAKKEEAFLREFKDWKSDIPVYTPEALIPHLDHLGQQGWELVHMQPVYVGDKGDVLLYTSGTHSGWTSTYFCVFKRPK